MLTTSRVDALLPAELSGPVYDAAEEKIRDFRARRGQKAWEEARSGGQWKYKYGFFTPIESIKAPKGLNEDIVRFISAKKKEPDWLLEWRLEA